MYKGRVFELLFWLGALLLFALATPGTHQFALCPLSLLNISWCPGCGLGRSLIYLLHGDIRNSFSMHWFGIPAFFIVTFRIVQLSKRISYNQTSLK
jgi:hypothetical protein